MPQDTGGGGGSVTRDDELGANEFLALRRSGALQGLKQTSNSGHVTRIAHVRLTRRPTLIGDVGSIQLIGRGRIVGNPEAISRPLG